MICYDTLKENKHISKSVCEKIKTINLHSYQWASLAILLLCHKNLSVPEAALLEWILRRNELIHPILRVKFPAHLILNKVTSENNPKNDEGHDDNFYKHVIVSTGRNSRIGKEYLTTLISKLINNQLSLDFLAVWLMIVRMDGLSEPDVVDLTQAMLNSGEIYDYRNSPKLENRQIIRRYPTGALSEKTALILPSLIAAFSYDYPIATTFFVGKSLGFTGGTWDKLSSIPGFSFPAPGEETIETLLKTHAAICVTQDSLNPADRLMYQFRSVTGTIDSIELIVASIASKQLAIPPDLLLLDVRYGEGAFMKSYSKGKSLLFLMRKVINEGGVNCIGKLRGTTQPNGASIGNSVEVAEATSIITGKVDHEYWDSRALSEQREIVIDFLIIMLDYLFPGKNRLFWGKIAKHKFENGEVQASYEKILSAHKVSQAIINKLCQDPNFLIRDIRKCSIKSTKQGILRRIDQKRLGYIINFSLGAGGNIYSSDVNYKCGLILRKRLGDYVSDGTELCIVLDDSQVIDIDLIRAIRECFSIV